MKKLTRKEFVTWLKDGSPRRIVGTPCNNHDCPLARYRGEPIVISTTLPTWAVVFMSEIDFCYSRVTARTCLKILGEAE